MCCAARVCCPMTVPGRMDRMPLREANGSPHPGYHKPPDLLVYSGTIRPRGANRSRVEVKVENGSPQSPRDDLPLLRDSVPGCDRNGVAISWGIVPGRDRSDEPFEAGRQGKTFSKARQG